MKSIAARIATVLAILLVIPSPADTRDKPVEHRSTVDRIATYSFSNTPADLKLPASSGWVAGGMALSSVSPGLVIGHTWYDYQRTGSMRRMTGWGQHTEIEIDSVEMTPGCTPANPCTTSTDYFISHFGWHYLSNPSAPGSYYVYQAWVDPSDDFASLRFFADTPVQPTGTYGGSVVIDVTNDNRAVIGGNSGQPRVYWDRLPSAGFYSNSLVPDSVVNYQPANWPAMAYQEGDGSAGFADTVAHVLASGGGGAIYYIRKVGGSAYGSGGVWDYPARIVDTTFVSSHDLFASHQTGKIAIAWTAPRPDPGDCDTCSSTTGNYSVGNVLLDNDLYYQLSLDQGATWEPRVNLTKRPHPDSITSVSFWPYVDLSLLIDDDDDEVHIVWNGRKYEPGSNQFLLACRIFHWSENIGFSTINDYGPGGASDGKERAIARTVHRTEWDQTTCNGGAWQLNTSKMTISRCNSKHYVIWQQYNDIPYGIENDCAERAFTGSGIGAANGEIILAVSGDGGITWDRARNLTESYSPHCDPDGGTRCESDVYSSMSPYGYNYAGDFPSNLVIPDNGSDNGWYLDIQYVSDPDAGGIAQNEGTWQEAEIKWFRIPCVDPAPSLPEVLDIYPNRIEYPTYVNHGVQEDVDVVLFNYGNITVNYSVNLFETSGPSGWLTVSGFSGTILPGLQGVDSGTVHLNTGGMVNSPGTVVALLGGLEIISNFPSSPDTIPVNCWVADTVVAPAFDTISSRVFSLVVANNGNMGNSGDGGVNMDFVHYDTLGPDCDSSNNVVLYDGSPFVMWVDGADTVANWSIFSDGWLSDRGFRPRVGKHKFESYLYESYSTGVFSTNDSSIFLEKTWYSPRNYGGNDQGFLVQCVKLWSGDGLGKNNITVGEAIDWDLPSDSSIRNSSGFVYSPGSPVFNLIYQQGANYADGDTTECQDNSRRVAGISPRGTFVNGTLLAPGGNAGAIYGAMTIDNPTFTFPTGTFVPQQLYDKITFTSGYEVHSSTDPDSEFVDLTTVVTNLHQYNLGATDTLKMYYVFASSKDTDPAVGAGSEFRNWIDAGIAFDNARVCYANWAYPSHIAYQATSITVAGDVTGGGPASASYNPTTNATTLTGTSPLEYVSTEGMCVTAVNGGSTAYHRVSWLSAETPTNTSGHDTIVFRHEGEGVGAAKTATFSWYVSNDQSRAVSLQGTAFADPSTNPNIDAFSTFIQGTTNLGNYTGWSPEVPAGYDIGVPRTVNETIVDRADIGHEWLYVKTTTDGGGGPYADGTQIDGFLVFQSLCTNPGDWTGSGGWPDIADVTYFVAYIYKGGPPPPYFPDVDIDDFLGLSFRDVCFMWEWASAWNYDILDCPSRPPLQEVAVAEGSTYLYAQEAFVPPASMLPPGQTTFTIHVNLQTNHTIQAGSFPFSIRLDDEIPQIDTVITPVSCPGGVCGSYWAKDDIDGFVWSGVWGIMEPGSHEIAAIEIDITPLTETYRTITIELDSLPREDYAPYSLAPWVTAPGYHPDVEVWLPRIGALPCIGEIRGNIDCDESDAIDIADLTFLIGYMFRDGIPLQCPDEADVNADLSQDIADLTYLVDYMFKSGPPPEPCPSQ